MKNLLEIFNDGTRIYTCNRYKRTILGFRNSCRGNPMGAFKRYFLKCKSCGKEWKKDKVNSNAILWCPKWGVIGNIDEEFDIKRPIEQSYI